MANEKKPSIYSDRSSIGSAEELDEYGVWVKSEPQVLSAIGSDIKKSGDLSLTPEVETAEETSAEDFPSDDFSSDDFSADDFSNEDFSVDDDSEDFASDEFTDKDLTPETSEDDSSAALSSQFDDIDFPSEDIEKNDVIDDVINNIEEVAEAEEDSDPDSLEDLNIEMEDDLQDSEITADSETDSLKADDDFDIDSNSDDISDDFSISDDEAGIAAIDDTTNADASDESFDMTSDDPDESSYEVPTVQSISGKSSTENIESNVAKIQENYETTIQNRESDLSTQLLLKIANELSSIRGELSELKKEFAIVRSSAPLTQETKEEQQTHEHSGFFSEEEDETIALTGDELDNILNTADFTEESGAAQTPESEFSSSMDADSMDADIMETDDTDVGSMDADIMDADSMDVGSMETDDMDVGSMDVDDTDVDSMETDDTIESLADTSSLDDLSISSLDMDDIDIDIAQDSQGIGIIDEPEGGIEKAEIEAIELDDAVSDDIVSGLDDTDFDDFTNIADDFDDENAVINDVTQLSDPGDDGIAIDNIEPEENVMPDEVSAMALDETSGENDDDLVFEESIDIDPEALESDFDSDAILNDTIETDELDADISQADFSDDIDVSENMEEIQIDGIMDTDTADLEATDVDESTDSEIDIDESKDSDELKALRAEGAQPVTFAPENSSYLEEEGKETADTSDPLGFDADEFDSDPIDLSDAIIDEPVLSTDGIDEPVTEPEIDLESFDHGSSLDDFSIDEAVEEVQAPVTTDEDSGGEDLTADMLSDEDTASEDTEDDDLDIEMSADDDLIIDEVADEELDIDMLADDTVVDDIPEPTPSAQTADSLREDSPADHITSYADDDFEQVIPEGFEAEIEEAPVPFDDDLEEEIAGDKIDDALDIPNEVLGGAEEEEIPQEEEIAEIPASKETIKQHVTKHDNYQMIPSELKSELRNILSYMDQLLDSLPEEKIEEFAKSEYFDSYKKLFKELGLV